MGNQIGKCPCLKKLLAYEEECNHFSPTHSLYPGTPLQKVNATCSFSLHVFLKFRNGTLECVSPQPQSECSYSQRSPFHTGKFAKRSGQEFPVVWRLLVPVCQYKQAPGIFPEDLS